MKKNCPNCGAPIEYKHDKCPYCSTVYFDLSEVDFDSDNPAPIFFRIKTNRFGGKDTTMLIKAIPRLGDITVTSDYENCYNAYGLPLYAFYTGHHCDMNINFMAVEQEDHSLFKIISEEKENQNE